MYYECTYDGYKKERYVEHIRNVKIIKFNLIKVLVNKYGKDKAEIFEKMIKNKAFDRKEFNEFKEVLGK